jgi:hypothetical protein
MAKTQNYTIVFKEPQSSVEDAMYLVGGHFSSIRPTIESGLINGQITTVSQSLSEDKKTLSCTRLWGDDIYADLLLLDSAANIKSLIENMEEVDSVDYGFSDA